MSRLSFQLLAAAVFLLAWTQSSALEPKRESGTLPIDPPTPYIRYFAEGAPRGRVLVIHGLDASKEVMQLISAAFADGGFEVYAIDLPGHGDAAAKFQTELSQQAIRNAKARLGGDTIVLGHSLGAGLVLDLAANEQFSTIILLSPPPLPISEIHADRVLIATGQIDIPRIRAFVPVAADIGAPHVEAWILPWSAHSAPIFNPVYIRRMVEWAGGNGRNTRTVARILWIALMFAAGVGFGVALMPGRDVEAHACPITNTLVRYVMAGSGALVTLKFVNPLRWLRLFGTDYLIGFVLLTGLLLVIVGIFDGGFGGTKAATKLKAAIIAAAFVIVVPGGLVTSNVLHMSLTAGRWWRFPFIAIAGLPLFISDELMIRRIHPRARSLAVALITRALFLAFLLTGVLILDRENAFLVLIAPLIVIFWIGLWFATGVVHRHTQDPVAAAVFAALVQGWAFAAWFVTI